jgi:hypothetical protein
MTRLCLFATPLDVLPFYRENVFPLAEAAGFVPVTAADVVNLGDSISAKIDTLIDRAAVMVVDASSPNTQFELGLAMARSQETETRPNRRRLEVLPVVTEFGQVPIPTLGHLVFQRPADLSEESSFVQDLARHLQHLADQMGFAQLQEPRRLLEAKEYRAAVISAMTLLETDLRQRLNKTPREAVRRPASMRQLLDLAREQGLANFDYGQLSEWTKIRNEAVHTGRPVTRNEAKLVVEGVERIVGLA